MKKGESVLGALRTRALTADMGVQEDDAYSILVELEKVLANPKLDRKAVKLLTLRARMVLARTDYERAVIADENTPKKGRK